MCNEHIESSEEVVNLGKRTQGDCNRMSTTALTNASVVQQGWEILVENLGLEKATQFVLLLERGKGDSVQELTDYWGDASIDEIHKQVMDWKSRQQ